VLCFTGDGGLYYHMTELETAIRYGINLVVLVNNNQALSQEFPSLNRNYNGKPYGHSDELWRFSDFNFAKVAEAMGCVGMRVEKPGEIKGALQEALSVNNKPVVLEVMSDVKEMAPPAWAP
jgi:acetolactate synthase-1/2/3 large subunit